MLSKSILLLLATTLAAQPPLLTKSCQGCHNFSTPLPTDRLIRIHDRIANHEMPPKGTPLPNRNQLLSQVARAIAQQEPPRIPLRRLTRDEYEQTLRDVLNLPHLDIRDMLPEDRVTLHFTKTADSLDISRVQLTAYLDAAATALRQALPTPQTPSTKFRAVGTALFQTYTVLTIDQAMFFAKDSKRIKFTKAQYDAIVKSGNHDPNLEMALFRSPGWPYAAFPLGYSAKNTGEYRVRFSARAVLQTEDFQIKPATDPIPMVFRSRKPTSHDIAEDVRATGDIIDITPTPSTHETTVYLNSGQTIEYGLFGLPVPLIDVFPNKPGTYRYPPFPPAGQPGVAFQWFEIEGPLPQPTRRPLPSIRSFIERASTRPVPEPPSRNSKNWSRPASIKTTPHKTPSSPPARPSSPLTPSSSSTPKTPAAASHTSCRTPAPASRAQKPTSPPPPSIASSNPSPTIGSTSATSAATMPTSVSSPNTASMTTSSNPWSANPGPSSPRSSATISPSATSSIPASSTPTTD